jgi:hypothetical protein
VTTSAVQLREMVQLPFQLHDGMDSVLYDAMGQVVTKIYDCEIEWVVHRDSWWESM